MKKSEIGSTFFAAEYQNDPVDNDALPIKRDMIQLWEKLPEAYNLYMAVDPAYSEDLKADFKTCVLVAVDTRGNRYLVNYIHTHDMQSDFNNAIINMYVQNKRRVVYVGIPNSGTEKSFFKQFIDECMRRGINIPVKELKNVVIDASGRIRKKKSARITASLQHLFEQGRYFVHASHSEALSELLNIGISKHDDIVDAITYCEQIIDPYMPSMPDDGDEKEPDEHFTGSTSVGYGL
jgi:phage terminase large subunit-like protein